MDVADCQGAFADDGCDALDGSLSDVADGEEAGHARLEVEGSSLRARQVPGDSGESDHRP